MEREKLPADATIETIVHTLNKPDEYVRRVLGHMHECKKKHGNAFVRIGTTGRGIAAHYRVEPKTPLEDFINDFRNEIHWRAFDGRNHKKLNWGYDELRSHSWSSGKMSYEEVQDLLGRLRTGNAKMTS